ncbi:MAG: LysM peptidoglycan-binding domain-containing protein [Alphaproteobacteria bacterium]|jgi:murein DD-endopeptidase MepM/ murein hydrolase activator NlpD
MPKKTFWRIIFLLLIFCSLPATALEITVKKGNTLYGLSQEYNISIREIIESNNLKRPYILRPGQTLKIPLEEYVVKPGESAQNIADKYGINVKELSKVNQLTNYEVKVGQAVYVPKKSTEEPSVGKVALVKVKNTSRNINKPANLSFKESYEYFYEQNSFTGRFSWPIRGKIIERFGINKDDNKNLGIIIRAPLGNDVYTSSSGLVEYVGRNIKGYGNLVVVRHGFDWLSVYANLDKIYFRVGQYIAKGEKVGTVGILDNGNDSGVFFALRNNREAVDPMLKLTR